LLQIENDCGKRGLLLLLLQLHHNWALNIIHAMLS